MFESRRGSGKIIAMNLAQSRSLNAWPARRTARQFTNSPALQLATRRRFTNSPLPCASQFDPCTTARAVALDACRHCSTTAVRSAGMCISCRTNDHRRVPAVLQRALRGSGGAGDVAARSRDAGPRERRGPNVGAPLSTSRFAQRAGRAATTTTGTKKEKC